LFGARLESAHFDVLEELIRAQYARGGDRGRALELANRGGDRGRLLWVRIGNCRRERLHDAFAQALESIVAAFESGQRVVELA
jgi:hypothetical protein